MTQAAIPFAGSTIIALEARHFEAIRRCVSLCFRIAHSPAWQARVDAGAPPHLRHAPGNFGVFMGYDFHLTREGPRLIEINTNAGGALVNGLHTAALCDPERLACVCDELLPVDQMESRLVGQFRDEFAAARGPQAALRRVAIVDDHPREQFLYPEFRLVRALFSRNGIEARIADTRELAPHEPGGLALGDWPVDLVYLRDTDFTLETPRAQALRDAYLAGSVVVTPSPREYHLLADKRRLTWLSSREELSALGVGEEESAFLTTLVPETRLLSQQDPDALFAARREWVFKPATSFGSRAVYRGDKLTRRRFAELLREPGYLVQRHAAPGELEVETSEGRRTMKFDVRAYAYRDQVLLLGARVYQGQVTNLRSPGGGFSAICVARGGDSS
ncbi:MAG TPA: hypothetical protein VMS55_07775 [Myxococcota bacterium]|nr:hypothetical protein [Myxococcota bacterium]